MAGEESSSGCCRTSREFSEVSSSKTSANPAPGRRLSIFPRPRVSAGDNCHNQPIGRYQTTDPSITLRQVLLKRVVRYDSELPCGARQLKFPTPIEHALTIYLQGILARQSGGELGGPAGPIAYRNRHPEHRGRCRPRRRCYRSGGEHGGTGDRLDVFCVRSTCQGRIARKLHNSRC